MSTNQLTKCEIKLNSETALTQSLTHPLSLSPPDMNCCSTTFSTFFSPCDRNTTFSIWPAFYFSSCTHTFPISSLVVVSNGFVIKSTALVQQVIRSENTAWAALSVSLMSSVQAKCQRMRLLEDVLRKEQK